MTPFEKHIELEPSAALTGSDVKAWRQAADVAYHCQGECTVSLSGSLVLAMDTWVKRAHGFVELSQEMADREDQLRVLLEEARQACVQGQGMPAALSARIDEALSESVGLNAIDNLKAALRVEHAAAVDHDDEGDSAAHSARVRQVGG